MSEHNLIAAAYAPMKSDFSLNTDIIGSYADFLLRNEVKGVFINGSTGDFVSLTIEERMILTEAWSEHRSNLYVIDHVGDTSLKSAKRLASNAVGKVDAIAALAPYYFPVRSVDKLVQYCKEISDAARGLPFYYYHIPSLSGADIDVFEFLKCASEKIPDFAGIKFTNNSFIDFLHCKNFKNGTYNILFGFDELFVTSLPMGAKGWVGSTYNHLAPAYYKIRELFNQNLFEEASALQEKAIRFVEILDGLGGFNGAGKSFMRVLGVDCGPSRFPHITLTDKQIEDVLTEFSNLGITQFLSK